MFTRIDHIMVAIADLTKGIEAYQRLGFAMRAGGIHPGVGTHNAIAFNEQDYLELLGLRDRAEYDAAADRGERVAGLGEFIDAGGGIRLIAVQSDGLEADVLVMRSRGVDVGPIANGSRQTQDGRTLRWLVAYTPDVPLFFIQHLTPLEERRGNWPAHANGVERLERTYIVVEDATGEAERYGLVLGLPVPPLQRGTVIQANMAVFQLGDSGLGIAQPVAEGPAADALSRRGPGPFQALYRTASLTIAVQHLEANGLTVIRGMRNTGEQAALVPPSDACGAYIGFVGPA